MVFIIADMNIGLSDMNRYTRDAICAFLASVKMGCGIERPVTIITSNSIESVVFGNTDIHHPSIHPHCATAKRGLVI